MYYLISYARQINGKEVFGNHICNMHPADWLINFIKKSPAIPITMIFAIEITENQYKELGENIMKFIPLKKNK